MDLGNLRVSAIILIQVGASTLHRLRDANDEEHGAGKVLHRNTVGFVLKSAFSPIRLDSLLLP